MCEAEYACSLNRKLAPGFGDDIYNFVKEYLLIRKLSRVGEILSGFFFLSFLS